jgi:branched-chain amino acid transport system permease protein
MTDADRPTEGGAGGARANEDEAVSEGPGPVRAARQAGGPVAAAGAFVDRLTSTERAIGGGVAITTALVVALVLVGLLSVSYLFYLLSLAGVYMLVAMGLNVQWGYAGIINFSVAAFFGIGAYAAGLATGGNSPLAGGLTPAVGLGVAVAGALVLALLIGLPTVTLRGDYLAIATLGLAEVVRLVFLSEAQWTNGTAGLYGIPEIYEGIPLLSRVTGRVETAAVNVVVVAVAVVAVWLLLRRVHRSPWGRVQRLIRTDEDLAEALGKDTRSFRLQAFLVGSVVMALAGVLFAHVISIVEPDLLKPIQTFYIWIAVIIGGTGSDRGAMGGALLVVAIQEGTRELPAAGSLRLLLVGALIILVIHVRPRGALPPQRERIWPGAGGEADE